MLEQEYDVAIIGGGVVGCALLFELSRKGYSCILLEKNQHIMSEASAGNSGMLHTGFDAPLFSLEQECIKTSQKTIFDIVNKFNIPHRKCGATLVAWKEEEVEKLPFLKQQAQAADIYDVNLISATDLYKQEPYLRKEAKGALSIPGECVIDSCLLGLCFANHARMQGSKICTNCEVSGVKDRMLLTNLGPVGFKVAVNCAGLYGDTVDRMADINTFSIHPRKGQYCVFDKTAGSLLNTILFPVPNESSKGVALFNSVYNNLMIGPTAENIGDRLKPDANPLVHGVLTQKAKWIIPNLAPFSPVGCYVGLRPATQFKDYQIRTYPQKGWITVGGIRSTGVSGSLGIAQYVSGKLLSDFGLEPERGSESGVGNMTWALGEDKTCVIFDRYQYHISHPMVLYGLDNINCKL
ncbi:hypothetical protein Btru_064819 [Bulinus truncatus]|nr:hypothetical protein Btru_064819 [Bulinus truncatus]